MRQKCAIVEHVKRAKHWGHRVIGRRILRLALTAMTALLFGGLPKAYADEVPPPFRGDWAADAKACQAGPRLRADREKLILMNGGDVASYGDVGVAHSFFGPDYRGIQVAVMPEVSSDYPFMVTFNFEERRGIASVEIYREIKGNTNPAVVAIQAKAKALSKRFPLDGRLLSRCEKAPR